MLALRFRPAWFPNAESRNLPLSIVVKAQFVVLHASCLSIYDILGQAFVLEKTLSFPVSHPHPLSTSPPPSRSGELVEHTLFKLCGRVGQQVLHEAIVPV